MIQYNHKLKRCFKVTYKYFDVELQEKRESEMFFKDLEEVRDWMTDTIQYNAIIEADLHGSRSDTRITIQETFIKEKKWFTYFNA